MNLYLKGLLIPDLKQKTGGKLKRMTVLIVTVFENQYVFEGENHGAKYSLLKYPNTFSTRKF